uniref:Chloride channel accessory 2 n=1 Tax=Salvator merianae TaxID=96440 RepID=A0A8D0DVM1_SALMN
MERKAKVAAATFPLSFALLLEFAVVGGGAVSLRANAYQGLLVAINPSVPEDAKIVSSIKEMITEASFYLFNATQGRVCFGSVKILIPATWKTNGYEKPEQELYIKADVIVAPPYWKHGHDPYTLQYRGCGEKGKYIHFTPDFLISNGSFEIYGSHGRLFVHEWAHLQWGVYDEYDTEKPFYITGQNQVKASRCSSELAGIYVCEKQSCTEGNCVIDQRTGLFKEGCAFILNKDQNASSSIMYMQSVSSVLHFCDTSSHNTEAPNAQNRMCSYKSTWDVIMSSDDFKFGAPPTFNSTPLPPNFSLLQANSDRVICLVLDFSSRMNENNRLNRMCQAIEIYLLQIVEDNSYVGIVGFSKTGKVKSQIRQIVSPEVRKQLASDLPVASMGKEANVCAGLQLALEVIKNHDGRTSGSEIILLSSGDDNTLSTCFSDVANAGIIIHTIAVGQSTSEKLEQLGRVTGGLRFFASDRPDSNSLTDILITIVGGHGDTSRQSVQIESVVERMKSNGRLNGTTTLDHTVGRDTFFVVTWQREEPVITLQDPRGKIYTTTEFKINSILHLARLQIPETAEVGDWTYTLANTHMIPDVFTMTVTSREIRANASMISVRVHANKDVNVYPNPVIVYAEVSQGFSPILAANVTAVIEPENGDPIFMDLFDNGAGADSIKNDGVYSRYLFAFMQNGRYSLKVHVKSSNKTVDPSPRILWSRAMYIPGYVTNGTIQMNPPRPLMNSEETQIRQGGFSRIASGNSFTVSGVPVGPYFDVFPPCKIIDLDARSEDNEIVLSWTAPGDDFDQGQAAAYEVRIGKSPLELREKFGNAASVNTSDLTPQQTGSREVFVFKPEVLANVTLFYVAVRTADKSFLYSDISNIALVAINPQKDNLSAPTKYGTLTVILSICGILLLVVPCLILSITLWTLKKKKKRTIKEAIL